MPHDLGKRSPWRIAARLLAILAVLVALLLGVGWLTSGPEADSDVEAVDGQLTLWFAQHRVAGLATPSQWLSALGSTPVVLVLGVLTVAVAGYAMRAWWPVRLLAAALVGELLIFLTVSSIVDRRRPPVPHLDAELPPTSSFPSGHTAAAVCLYGGIAALIWLVSRSRWRWAAAGAAVLFVVGVATARLYRGAHWSTDVAASLLFASAWLWTCVRSVVPPAPEHPRDKG